MLENANRPGAGVLASMAGLVLLLLGASGLFTQLQDSLNAIWDAKRQPGGGIVAMAKKRLLTFGMVLVIGFLLLVSLVISAAIAAEVYWMRSLPIGHAGR